MHLPGTFVLVVAAIVGLTPTGHLLAFEPPQTDSTSRNEPSEQKSDKAKKQQPIALNPQKTVFLDRDGKRLLLKGEVVLREGLLEMLCCLKQTKEHESVLAVDSEAAVIHAGLLTLGAKPGEPAKYTETEYVPASGQRINIFLEWKDADGKLQRATAQSWVRYVSHRFYGETLAKLPANITLPEDSELRFDEKNQELVWFGRMTDAQRDEFRALSDDAAYRKALGALYKRSQYRALEVPWVFSGSGFEVDSRTGERYYLAESGDLICVSNFPTAMLDLSIKSSPTNEELLFEPYTERIPPLQTPVTIELVPDFGKPAKPEPQPAE